MIRLPLQSPRSRGVASTGVLIFGLVTAGLFGGHAPAALAVAQAPVAPNRTSALINEELDKPITLNQTNRALPEVLEIIEQQTGIRFDVKDGTWATLPYGRQTPISVNAKDTSLRLTLDAITRKLGLQFVLRDEAVEIRPLPALARIGRRATVQEIAGLALLAEERIELLKDRPAAWELLEAIDLRLQELDQTARELQRPAPGLAVEVRLDDAQREAPVFVSRTATLLQAMEAIAEQTSATWYPWADTFIVLPKSDWVARQLDAPVNLSYNTVEIMKVLDDLEDAAGVPFEIEPGALQYIPESSQRVRLFLDNATVREALESLGSVTGLGYSVRDTGIYIWNSRAGDEPRARRSPGAGGPAESPVVIVDLGDGASLLLYEEDLPDELRRRVEARRAEAIDLLRRSLPAEAPATQPSPPEAN